MLRIDLIADPEPFELFLKKLLELLANVPLERRQFVVDRLQGLLGGDCVRLENLPALRADVIRVALEPSEKLCLFAVAVRAGEFDALAV